MRHRHRLLVTALALSVSAVAPWAVQDAAAQPAARGRAPARASGTPDVRRGAAAPVTGPVASLPPSEADQLPSSLPGTWKISLCIAGEQSWIRLENGKTGEFHTLSRSGQNPKGVQWDLDVSRESELTSVSHIRASVTVQNPRIFRGTDKERGYRPSTGNCAGFARDAWHFYSREWYPLPSPPSAAALRELVLQKHPEQPPVYVQPPAGHAPGQQARRPRSPSRGR